MSKVKRSINWFSVPSSHDCAEITNQLAVLFKTSQFLLVLISNVAPRLFVVCCKNYTIYS